MPDEENAPDMAFFYGVYSPEVRSLIDLFVSDIPDLTASVPDPVVLLWQIASGLGTSLEVRGYYMRLIGAERVEIGEGSEILAVWIAIGGSLARYARWRSAGNPINPANYGIGDDGIWRRRR